MCAECEDLKTQVHDLDLYSQRLVDDLEIESRKRRDAEREAQRLSRELHGSRSKESEEIRAVLEEWDRVRRKLFQGCRDVNLDMNGERAKAVRAAKRRGWSQERLLKVIRGAAFDQDTAKQRHFYDVENVFRKDRFMEQHEQLYDDYIRLRDAGFAHPVRLIKQGVSKRARQGTPEWWQEMMREHLIYLAWEETRQPGAVRKTLGRGPLRLVNGEKAA